MAAPNYHARVILERILRQRSLEDVLEGGRPRRDDEEALPPRLSGTSDYTAEAVAERRKLLSEGGIATEQLAGEGPEIEPAALAGNIENFIGFARLPVGVVGPLRINGAYARGDFYVPMATSEGALVASYHRGAYLVSRSGGVTAACFTESVCRAPCFVFDNLVESGRFLGWVLPRFEQMQQIVERTTRHGRLIDLKVSVLGKEVYLILEFHTGDAAGQNMVTLSTDAVVADILAETPQKPRHWFLDGNLSGDKKATAAAFTSARGKKVVADAVIDRKLVRRFLHTEPEQMVRYWQISSLGGVQSGSIGVHGHYANALAALFIACGQDAACVAEASVGVTRMDLTPEGDLYTSVSMPNLIVGTVGGGTRLPTAAECLAMVGCVGTGTAPKFAEICCATVLAGEVSIIGAMSAGDFGQAHARYGRTQKKPEA
jgi:hydroxymethylglutaryl-CoA reductase (NADPH)